MIIAIDRLVSPHNKNGSGHTQRVEIDTMDIKDVTPVRSFWHEQELTVIHFHGPKPSIVVTSSDYKKMQEIIDARTKN